MREAFDELMEQYRDFEEDCIEGGYNPPINMEFHLESSLIHKFREEDAERQSRFKDFFERWEDRLEFDCAAELKDLLDLKPETKEHVEYATLTLGYLSDNVVDWCKFCNVVGLNEWCLAEGRASRGDSIKVPIDVLRKQGIMC